MELSYRELSQKDVINVSDGRCLGRIIDLKLVFPEGRLIGITVPGRKVRKIFRFFDKSELYIEERKIIKIGGDVILVDVRCSEEYPAKPIKPPKPPKHQNCPPLCPPNKNCSGSGGLSVEDFKSAFDDNDY